MFEESYDEWVSLYSDEIKSTWLQESSALRKISMIYCAFQTELERLKISLGEELKEIKAEVKRKNILDKCKNFAGLAQTEGLVLDLDTNKENEPITTFNETEDFLIESPNTESFLDRPVLIKTPKSSPSLVTYPLRSHKIDKNDPDIMESSIIDNTPESKPRKYRNSKLSLKMKKSQTSTLTQMLTSPKKKKKREIDSQGPAMSINAMLDVINQTSGSETDETLDNLDFDSTGNKLGIMKLSPKKDKRSAQDFFANKVVRGKERKQLKGWACKECENFYSGMKLSTEELEKKMDQCSKHRHKFQPRDDTYSRFWDLTFGPTPKTQAVTEKLPSYRK